MDDLYRFDHWHVRHEEGVAPDTVSGLMGRYEVPDYQSLLMTLLFGRRRIRYFLFDDLICAESCAHFFGGTVSGEARSAHV